MLISEQEFKEDLENKDKRKHVIIFIGMTGSGKSHWSKLLEKKYNLHHVEIDNLIGNSEEFKELIKDIPGKDVTEKVGNFFGNPWENDYTKKEDTYLALEKKFMSQPYKPGTILDLTGSAIYFPEQMEKLSKIGLIIYLETSHEAQDQMLKIYLENPKPVCWDGVFKKKDDETNEKALARCFAELLKYRSKLYEKFADLKLEFEIHKNLKTPEEFVQEVGKRL